MFKELLARYRGQNNGLMPERIIYYRDGTSESEFLAIRDKEGAALRQLVREFGTKITIISAVKRHHTRFMADGEFATKLG
jgi:eukaryotic translation initiation factor 2C